MTLVRRVLALSLLAILALLSLAVGIASAADSVPAQPHTFAFPIDQTWAIFAGAIAPLLTYVVNRVIPTASEEIKSFIFLIGAAVAGGITQAITAGNVGFNDDTLQFVLFSIVGAIGAHTGFWTRNNVSARLTGTYRPKR